MSNLVTTAKTLMTVSIYGLCNAEVQKNWVGRLPRISKAKIKDLADQGIELIHDIPEDFGLTDLQKRVYLCVKNGEPYIEKKIQREFKKLKYPLYFMDFETYDPAIPRYVGMRPFNPIPFQWSVHVQRNPGSALEHHEFLAENADDPREAFIKGLLEVLEDSGGKGHIISYFASFESRRLDDLAAWFPRYAPKIKKVKTRLWDLIRLSRITFIIPNSMVRFPSRLYCRLWFHICRMKAW